MKNRELVEGYKFCSWFQGICLWFTVFGTLLNKCCTYFTVDDVCGDEQVASHKGYPSASLGFLDPTRLNAQLDLLRVLESGSQPEVRSAATTTSWPQCLTAVHFCRTADALREIWS